MGLIFLSELLEIELSFNPGNWEVTAGTVCYVCSGSSAMAINSIFGDTVAVLQRSDQFQGRVHLLYGRSGFTKIANETNAYAFRVSPVARCTPAMSACFLFGPAIGGFDLTVAAVCTVSDNKMVSDAVPMAFFFMPFVEYCGISGLGGGMMNYYRDP